MFYAQHTTTSTRPVLVFANGPMDDDEIEACRIVGGVLSGDLDGLAIGVLVNVDAHEVQVVGLVGE